MPVVQCPTCRATADLPHFEMGRKVNCGICNSSFVAKNQFDFSDSRSAGLYDRSNGRNSRDQTGGVVCLFLQFGFVFGVMVGFCASIPALIILCAIGLLIVQFCAVIWVAGNSRGKGAETPVWCLVVLLFPFVGLIAYISAS